MKRTLMAVVVVTLVACEGIFPTIQPRINVVDEKFNHSNIKKLTGNTYIPLEPIPVAILRCEKEGLALKPLLDSLPDHSVRTVIKEFDASGKISFGAVDIGVQGGRYQITLDYINSDTVNIWISVIKTSNGSYLTNEVTLPQPSAPYPEGTVFSGSIPVYVGVGLRLTADLKVSRGAVKLSSLGSIAAAVEAGNASGSLVVQTLGLTGKHVSTVLPLPSDLNQTTVQNAILALGSIKAILNNEKSLIVTPRAVGIFLPFYTNDDVLVSMIISQIGAKEIPWSQPCEKVTR